MRYFYATALTRERAEDILEECYATGEVSQAERPRIETYHATRTDPNRTTRDVTRYAITLEG